MKILIFAIILINCPAVYASESCVTVLTKNNIPRSRAINDCKKTVLLHREKNGEIEVSKDVPIYGAVRPEWMTRNTYNRLKKDCYNNSAEAFEAACAAGYSISEDGTCRLPTFNNGERIRESTTPIYDKKEDCYQKKGIFGQRGSRKVKSMEPSYTYTKLTYDEILDGSFSAVREKGAEVAKNIKNCMEIVGNTPRALKGLSDRDIYNTPGKRQANSVFALCNVHSARSIVENEECYKEINQNIDNYPPSSNLRWYASDKKSFCLNLMKYKDDIGFINCKNEVMNTVYQVAKSSGPRGQKETRYLSFIEDHSPKAPDIQGCLNHKNLKWFSKNSNLKDAKACSKKVISSIGYQVKAADVATLLQNCYASNLTNICYAMTELPRNNDVDIFDLCGSGVGGAEKFNLSRMESCSGDPQNMSSSICQYRCLSFLIPQIGRESAIKKCSSFKKYGSKEFQHCFYLINNQYGGNMNVGEALSFCPRSEFEIKVQLRKGNSQSSPAPSVINE